MIVDFLEEDMKALIKKEVKPLKDSQLAELLNISIPSVYRLRTKLRIPRSALRKKRTATESNIVFIDDVDGELE